MPHKPLSSWVASICLPDVGVAEWDPGSDINDGNERTDARFLSKFEDGWQRRSIQLDVGNALGLVYQDTAQAIVELNELAWPIPITDAGMRVISDIEDHWTETYAGSEVLDVLAREDMTVRHLLLSRLAAEGQPAAALFHTLPWHLVDELVDEVIAMLGGAQSELGVRLRHWFTPAGSRFSAALEQLAVGLHSADKEMSRVGGTALCGRLLNLDKRRVPPKTRQILRRLIDVLASHEPFLLQTARRVAAQLEPYGKVDYESAEHSRLTSALQPAALTGGQHRAHSEELEREPFNIRLTVTDTDRLEIIVKASLTSDLITKIIDDYRVMLIPLTIRTLDGEMLCLVPLRLETSGLEGTADLPLPPGEFNVDMNQPPIGLAEARFLNEEEVRQSVRAVTTHTAMRPWQELAEYLPPDHSLHAALARLGGGAE